MAKKYKLRRSIAAVMSLALMAGAIPCQPFSNLIISNEITASAEETTAQSKTIAITEDDVTNGSITVQFLSGYTYDITISSELGKMLISNNNVEVEGNVIAGITSDTNISVVFSDGDHYGETVTIKPEFVSYSANEVSITGTVGEEFAGETISFNNALPLTEGFDTSWISGLPEGLTASFNSNDNTLSISGTPTEATTEALSEALSITIPADKNTFNLPVVINMSAVTVNIAAPQITTTPKKAPSLSVTGGSITGEVDKSLEETYSVSLNNAGFADGYEFNEDWITGVPDGLEVTLGEGGKSFTISGTPTAKAKGTGEIIVTIPANAVTSTSGVDVPDGGLTATISYNIAASTVYKTTWTDGGEIIVPSGAETIQLDVTDVADVKSMKGLKLSNSSSLTFKNTYFDGKITENKLTLPVADNVRVIEATKYDENGKKCIEYMNISYADDTTVTVDGIDYALFNGDSYKYAYAYNVPQSAVKDKTLFLPETVTDNDKVTYKVADANPIDILSLTGVDTLATSTNSGCYYAKEAFEKIGLVDIRYSYDSSDSTNENYKTDYVDSDFVYSYDRAYTNYTDIENLNKYTFPAEIGGKTLVTDGKYVVYSKALKTKDNTVTVGNIEYALFYNSEDDSHYAIVTSIEADANGDVAIPESIKPESIGEEYTVTGFANYAFENLTEVKTLAVPRDLYSDLTLINAFLSVNHGKINVSEIVSYETISNYNNKKTAQIDPGNYFTKNLIPCFVEYQVKYNCFSDSVWTNALYDFNKGIIDQYSNPDFKFISKIGDLDVSYIPHYSSMLEQFKLDEVAHTHYFNNADGTCTICGKDMCEYDENGIYVDTVTGVAFYQPAEYKESESFSGYEVENAGQLIWLSQQTDLDSTSITISITKDITIPATLDESITSIFATYAGTFNGNGHTIDLNGRTLITTNNGTVKNVNFKGIKGSAITTNDNIVGNCCFVDEKPVAGETNSIVGTNNKNLALCYAVNANVVDTNNNRVNFCAQTLPTTISGVNTFTSEDFASGELAFEFNSMASKDENMSSTPWGQEIGKDAYPVFNGKTVYKGYAHGETDEEKALFANTPFFHTEPDSDDSPHNDHVDPATIRQITFGEDRATHHYVECECGAGETIKAPHNFGKWENSEDGESHERKCIDCGYVDSHDAGYDDYYVFASGHVGTWSGHWGVMNYAESDEGKCGVEGCDVSDKYFEGPFVPHDFKTFYNYGNEYNHQAMCDDCGSVWNQAHHFDDQGICKDCGYEMALEKYISISEFSPVVSVGKTKVHIAIERNIPSRYTIVKTGILFNSKGTVSNADDAAKKLIVVKDSNGNYVTGAYASTGTYKNTANKGTYTVNITNTDSNKVYARGYAVVKDADGNEKIVYTDVKSANYKELANTNIKENTVVKASDLSIIEDKGVFKVRAVINREVGKGYTVVNSGVVVDKSGAVKDGVKPEDVLVIENKEKYGLVVGKNTSNTSNIGTYKANISSVKADDVYVRGYVTVRDAQGNECVVYTDVKSINYKECVAEKIEENTSISLDYSHITSEKLQVTVSRNVADGCKVVKSGVVVDKNGAIEKIGEGCDKSEILVIENKEKYNLIVGGNTSNTALVGTYTANITQGSSNIAYVRGYVIVERDGVQYTVYTDVYDIDWRVK